jgi:hypothetical protein
VRVVAAGEALKIKLIVVGVLETAAEVAAAAALEIEVAVGEDGCQ